MLGVKNLSVGICDGDGAPSTVHSTIPLPISHRISYFFTRTIPQGKHYYCSLMNGYNFLHFLIGRSVPQW